MRNGIMIIHPSRSIIYEIDYVFLFARDRLQQKKWYFALRTICKPYETLYENSRVRIFGHSEMQFSRE